MNIMAKDFGRLFLPELRGLLDLQEIGIWIVNPAGDVLYINPAGMAAVGIEKLEDVLEKNTVDMSETGYSTSVTMEQVIKGRKPVFQRGVVSRMGQNVDIFTFPVLTGQGEIAYIVSLNIPQGNIQVGQETLIAHQITSALIQPHSSDGIIVESEEMKAVVKVISRVAAKEANILLAGESGVGKDEAARLIHRLSRRASGPFVSINCSAIPENLLESELFGYEKGAFTGATATRAGLLEMGNKGTVFLDEIGDLSLSAQVKLLRVLQNRSFLRIGGKKPMNLDVRFITATHQPLEALVADGKFREDFYYRINVIRIEIPPLRKRKGDIMPLCFFFADKFEKKYNEKKYFSRMTERMLKQYTWPGNVRELENAIEQAMTLCPYSIVSPNYLPAKIRQDYHTQSQTEFPSLHEAVQSCERELIREVIQRYDSSRKAARVLGVDQKTVLRKMRALDLQWPKKEPGQE